jgi:streptogramin lyase
VIYQFGKQPRHLAQAVARLQSSNPACLTCDPPLQFNPGAYVMGGMTGTPGDVTIVPVFWAPSGYGFSASYKSLIEQYLSDVAAASGSANNVFAVATEYYQQIGSGPDQYINYDVHAGAELDLTDAYPASSLTTGCVADTGYSACVTDGALQQELRQAISAQSLPADDSHLYMVFLPSGVESCQSTGSSASGDSCSSGPAGSTSIYCAYHSALDLAGAPVIYANLPYPNVTACSDPYNGPQSPNGNVAADTAISMVSHEAIEAITDWEGAWIDPSGWEIADECAYVYGAPIGGGPGSYYNQVINGHHYYTQDEFSNNAYSQGIGDVTSPTDPLGTPGADTQVPGCVQQPVPTPVTLQPSPSTTIAPGTLVGFPGTGLGSSQAASSGSVSFVNSSGASSPVSVANWGPAGIILWIPATTPVGDYTLTVTAAGESASVDVPLTAPTDASQAVTPLYNDLPAGSTSLPLGLVQDRAGDTWFTDAANNSIDELTTSGSLMQYPLSTPQSGPTGIAIDPSGNLWVTQNLSGQVTQLDVAEAVPGTTDGETSYALSPGASPDGISADAFGNIWVGEGDNGVLAEIPAGSSTVDEWSVGSDLEGMVADAFGNVWAVDEGQGILQIVPSQLPAPTTASMVTSGVYLVGGGIGAGTEQIAVAPNGDVWFTQWGPPELGVIVPNSSDPSADQWAYAENYPSTGGAPSGIAVDAGGNVWVADASSESVYEFTPSSIDPTTSVAGQWTSYSLGTWVTNYPEGDEGNNLLVTPSGNIVFSGYVTNTSTSDTPYSAGDVQGYIGTLPGIAASASSEGVQITGGTTSQELSTGSGGDTLTIPGGDSVETLAGLPFSGTISPPAPSPSFVPPAVFGTVLPGSAFAVTPVESDGATTHLVFSEPITLTFTFPLPAGVTAAEAEAATLWTYNPSTDVWAEAGTASGDPGGTITVSGTTVTITVQVTHLSSFALLTPAAGTPTLSSLSPSTVSPGGQVILSGSNLGSSVGSAKLTPALGTVGSSVALAVDSWSPNSVVVTVPAGQPTGSYSVALMTSAGTSTNFLALVVQRPSTTSTTGPTSSSTTSTTGPTSSSTTSSSTTTTVASGGGGGFPPVAYVPPPVPTPTPTPTPTPPSPVTTVATKALRSPRLVGYEPPTATVGLFYRYVFAATGSPLPAFGLYKGTLPPGLKLTSAGVLLGTPHKAGRYVFVVKASSSAGHALSPTITLIVAASRGYWLVASNGGLFAFGAPFYGSVHAHLAKPVVAMAATPDGHGYWLVTKAGQVLHFGDAHSYGSPPAHLAKPVVAMAATPDGHGYWLVTKAGQVLHFGDAHSYGSPPAHLAQPVVAIAPTPGGHGYWLIASNGGVFSYGKAAFRGSIGKLRLRSPVVGAA